ncbi:protein of unknown function [Candidatus Filomicrobium marinum]|uniref:Uncharacterized protein n=1 Tax=Candidatus Filomicrobium marinum TaxID=1608628 RepID=A0A0D6JB45_9HYPH|nr:protein of unknown function [Candidatus Filomicrobium marinum]CPR15181.1 protein of unknown function [Candidatus Filomicrobium marinum]
MGSAVQRTGLYALLSRAKGNNEHFVDL